MKPLVVGAVTESITPALWATSLRKTSYDGNIVLITSNPSKDVLELCYSQNIHIIAISDPMCQPIFINRQRRFWFANLIATLQLHNEWVVATDVRDLYFQGDPITWLNENANGYDLVLSSEGITYEHSPWNSSSALFVCGPSFYSTILRSRVVLNGGLVAGRAWAIKELFQEVHHVASALPGRSDQVVLNAVLALKPGRWRALVTDHSTGWGCHGAVMADPLAPAETIEHRHDPLPIVVGGVVTTPDGKPYVAVHQYDRVPEWSTIVSKKLNTIELSSKK